MKNSRVSVVSRTRPVSPYPTTRSGSSGSTTSIIARGDGRVIDDVVGVAGLPRACGWRGPSACCRRSARSSAPSSSSSTAKRWNCGVISVPPQKTPVMPALLQRDLLAERLQQLRRREQAADVVVRAQHGERLVDHVLLVAPPPRRACPSSGSLMTQRGSRSTMKQMPPRCCARCSTARRSRRGPRGPDRQPVGALREELVGQRVAERLVVEREVLDVDARLRDAGAAARLEDGDRLPGEPLRHPAPDGPAAQPLVLEEPERARGPRSPARRGAGRTPARGARSSQNGEPVAGSKCHATISRVQASSRCARVRPASASSRSHSDLDAAVHREGARGDDGRAAEPARLVLAGRSGS